MTAAEHVVQPEELMAYLDGELPPERAAMVLTHFPTCMVCQKVSDDLRGVSRDLAAWRAGDAPATLGAPEASGSAKLNMVPARSLRRWLLSRPAIAIELAGLAAVMIAGVSLIQLLPARKPAVLPAPPSPGAIAQRDVVLGRARGIAAAEKPEGVAASAPVEQPPSQLPRGPQIVRTASIRIVTDQFETGRLAVDRILKEMGGFVGQVDVTGSRGAPRSLRATLRVPAARLDATLAELKKLGQVVAESQGGDDVTEQIVDLEARLTNHRNMEKRLTELLQKRTGDLADVLAAEREIARVREEIERLDAQRKNLEQRVSYATLTLELLEERKAELDLGTTSVAARFRNALVDGVLGAADSLLEFALWAIRVGPFLLLWALILAIPARFVVRWLRRANA
jgi:anti-sigma factor RsiW